MRPLIAAVALAMVVATGACWYPAQPYHQSDAQLPLPDAPQGPCQMSSSPVPAEINITGTVRVDFNPNGAIGPVAGAMVAVFLQDDMTNAIAFAPSNGDGTFTLHYPTRNFSRPIVVKVTASGYLDTYYYPAVAVSADLDVTLELFTATSAPDFMKFEGVNMLDLSLASFAISVYDCNGKALANASVSTVPSAAMDPAVHYLVDNPAPSPSMTARSTDGYYGLAFAVNVPVGNTTIEATVPLPDNPSAVRNLRSNFVTSVKNALIQVDIVDVQP